MPGQSAALDVWLDDEAAQFADLVVVVAHTHHKRSRAKDLSVMFCHKPVDIVGVDPALQSFGVVYLAQCVVLIVGRSKQAHQARDVGLTKRSYLHRLLHS